MNGEQIATILLTSFISVFLTVVLTWVRSTMAKHTKDQERNEARARWEGTVQAQLDMLAASAIDHGNMLRRIDERFDCLPCGSCHTDMASGRRKTVEEQR